MTDMLARVTPHRPPLAASAPTPQATRLARSLLGALIPLLLQPALAEQQPTVLQQVLVQADAQQNNPTTSKTVSTTASKTATPLSKTPQTVSVVTKKEMDEKGVTSVAEALNYSSGVVTNYRGTSNRNDEVMARGMSGYLPQYLDGISFASGSSGASLSPQIDPWLLEKVELIHGPASVLYGQSAPGGLISLTSKRPTRTPVHEIEIATGTNNRRQAAFDLGGATDDSGKMLFRVAGIATARDGQEKFVNEERYAIAPSVTFQPNDQFSFTLLASFQKDPDAGYRNFLPAEGTLLSNANGKIPTSFFVSDPNWENANREQNSIGYQMEYVVNDKLTLRQNARYTRLQQQTKTVIFDSWADSSQTVMNRWAQKFNDKVNSTGIDNQAEYQLQTGAVRHTLLGGVDYKRYQYDNRSWSDRDADNDLDLDWTNPVYGLDTSDITLSPTINELQTRKQLGVYLQDQMEVGRWNLVLSGRHDHADLSVHDRLGSSHIDTTASKATGRAGVMYTFDNGIAPYISYATSFEPITTTDASGNLFKPTTAKQREAGVKYAPKAHDVQATVAVFDLKQQNVVTTDPVTRLSDQTGEVGSKGVEVETRAGLTKALTWTTSYTYLDAKTLKSDNASEVGLKTQWVPRHSASSWLGYQFDMGLDMGAGVRYVGETYSRTNALKVPHYTLADLSVGYDLGKASSSLKGARAQLTVNNLFDHEYVSTCSATWACFYGEGRSAMAKINYRW